MKVVVNKDISVKTFVMITILAVIIGTAMIYIATKGFISVNILNKCKKEFAEIYLSEIDYREYYRNDMSSPQRKVKYKYIVDNQQYEGEDILWWRVFASDINVQEGDKIEIFYNINNPSKSEIYHVSYILIIVGILGFIILPILFLKQRIKES